MSKRAERAAFYRRQRDARHVMRLKRWAAGRPAVKLVRMAATVLMAIAPEVMQFWGDEE